MSPVSICKYPGCTKRIQFREQYCDEHKKKMGKEQYKQEKNYSSREYAYLYHSKKWRDRRLRQLMRQPLCEDCLREGRITLATVADHIIPHRGDKTLFYYGELQSLCHSHHSKKTQQEQAQRKNK